MKIIRRRLAFPILLLSILASHQLLAGSRPSDAEAEAAAITTVTRFVRAQTGYDQPAFEQLLASGYTEISPLGQLDARSAVIAFYDKEAAAKAATAGITQTADLDEIATDIGSDSALVTAREVVVVDRDEAQRTTAFRVSFFLHKSDSGWLIKATQYTPIRDPGGK